MCAQRLWPSVQALGRGLVGGHAEILQQGVKAYNAQNFTNHHYAQGPAQNNSFTAADRFAWTQKISHSARGSFSKVVTRSIHSGTVLFYKTFADTENEHAHEILCSLPAYHETTVSKDISFVSSMQQNQAPYLTNSEWSKCSSEEIANGFIAMSQQCHYRPMNLEDTKHSGLCSVLAGRLRHLSDSQLLRVLHSLSLWPPTEATTTPNFVALWNSLDHVCSDRIRKWNMAQMFLVADHWFVLRLSRISSYNIKMTKLLGHQVSSMGPSQLVQYLFYANLSRKLQPFIMQKDMEKRLLEVMDYVSVEELAVIAMGFFKTQTFLKQEKLIEGILKKTQANLECVSDTSLCAILKLLRKSIASGQWRMLQGLQDALVPQLDRLGHMCLLQVALLGTDLLLYHPTIMETIVMRFSQEMSSLRLKDLERLTFALMLYNHVPSSCPDFFHQVTEELRRPERLPEFNLYPKSFVSSVVYLTTMGLFPQDLISAALQPSMLDLLSLNQHYSNMGREVNELDWTLEVEGPPKYLGYRLHPDKRAQLTKEYLGSLPVGPSKNLTHHQSLMLDVQDKLAAMIGGHNLLTITHVLPHQQVPDIVFCTNMAGEAREIPQEYMDLPGTTLKRPLFASQAEELQWNAVIVAGRNTCLRNTTFLRGQAHMKQRQLVKLGYNVSVVPYRGYNKCSQRVRLLCLERVLGATSTLNSRGKAKTAWITIKGSDAEWRD